MIKVLRNLLIFRSLVATYGVILEQNPSGILISKPIGPGKWVVENFDSISPGLLSIDSHGPQQPRIDIFDLTQALQRVLGSHFKFGRKFNFF